MKTALILPFLFIISFYQSFGQVLNGGFENWESLGSAEIPSDWDTYIYWADYSDYIVKDSSAYEGEYALKLIGGTVYSEGDCLRQVTGKFGNEFPDSDSLILSFAYKSVSRNSLTRTDFRIEVNGDHVFGSNEPQDDYKYYTLMFENPNSDSLNINMESHRFGSVTDGCPHISDHWIDAVKISSLISSAYDKIEGETISIYPNPASDYIIISVEEIEDFNVKLYSMSGKKITSFSNEKIVDLSKIPAGTYLVEVTDAFGKEVYTDKLIKE